MKLVILSICVACVFADVSHIVKGGNEKDALIRSQVLNLDPEGSYQWEIETENGIRSQANGQLKVVEGADSPVVVVSGANSWRSPDGAEVQVSYIADENGYQPQGDSLPTSPPIPEPIVRLLEYLRTHPPQVEKA